MNARRDVNSRHANGAMRNSTARWKELADAPTANPSVILLFHIEKTGGSAVMKWLHKQVGCRLGRGPMEGQTICRASPLDDGLPRRLGAAWPD